GADRPPWAGPARRRGLLARRRGGAADGGEVPGEGRPARGGLGQHPARRDLPGDARAAGPGGRGRRRVHEGHAHVTAPAAGRAARRGFPAAAGQDGRGMAKDFDFTEEVRGLQVPTLIVAADADMAPPTHYVEVFSLLDGGHRDGGWMGEGRPKGGHALAIL